MIVIFQDRQMVLRGIQEETRRLNINNISFASTANEAVRWVQAAKGRLEQNGERTVVVSSAVFGSGGDLEVFVQRVKRADSTAWLFLWTFVPPKERVEGICGIIPKPERGDFYVKLMEFLSANPSTIGSIDELRQRLPWMRS